MFAKIVILLLFAIHTHGWGGRIHQHIAAIGWNHMNQNAKRFLRHHLGRDTKGIIQASKWADSEEAFLQYPDSRSWHFSNTPHRDCRAFDLSRDCGTADSLVCIVTMIRDFTILASNPETDKSVLTDAIKFLLHFVADIHQPLHTGFREDDGGTRIRLREPFKSLHEVWDHDLFDPSYKFDQGIVNEIATPNDTGDEEAIMKFASDIATESATLLTCSFSYKEVDNEYITQWDSLSEDYMIDRTRIASERIRLAGIRLGELFNSIADTHFRILFSGQTVADPLHGAVVSHNSFADLSNNESDDEEVVFEIPGIGVPVVESPPYPNRRPKRVVVIEEEPDIELEQFGGPYKVGEADLNDTIDFVNVNHKSICIFTCKSVLKRLGPPKFYSPTGATQGFYTLFRDRANAKFEWFAYFIIDPACFGSRELNSEELEIIKQFLGKSMRKSLPGSTVMETRVLPSYDPLGFAKVRGEKEFTFLDGSRARLWSMKGLSLNSSEDTNKTLIGHRLNHAEQRINAQENNITIEEKWFRDVRANRDFIRAESLTRANSGAYIVYHVDTFSIPRLFKKRRFAVFGELTAFSSGRLRNVILIDTNLFDGLLTPRILHFIFLLQKTTEVHDESSESSFTHERNMLSELIFREGLSRLTDLRTKNMLDSFSAYTSSLSPTMGYYEWTINPEIDTLEGD